MLFYKFREYRDYEAPPPPAHAASPPPSVLTSIDIIRRNLLEPNMTRGMGSSNSSFRFHWNSNHFDKFWENQLKSLTISPRFQNTHFSRTNFFSGNEFSRGGCNRNWSPPGGGQKFTRYFWNGKIFSEKTSLPYSKSYSGVQKHIPDTSRRSRRV